MRLTLSLCFCIYVNLSPACAQQVIRTGDGADFMEEVKQEKQQKTQKPELRFTAPEGKTPGAGDFRAVELNYEGLGVTLGPGGKMVPLLGKNAGSPASGSSFEYSWGLPQGYVPAWNPWTRRRIAVPYTLYAPNLPPGSMPLSTKTEPWAPTEGIIIDTGRKIHPRDDRSPLAPVQQ